MSGKKLLKYLFVLNKGAGANPSMDWRALITAFFGDRDEVYEIYDLPDKIKVPDIKTYIISKMPETVVAVGGDGTIAMLAGILAETGITLGILPAGSANGMAKELGIPDDATKAMEIIAQGASQTSDLIDINGNYCLHLSDLGLNAQLIKYFDEGKLRGKWGYARVVLKTLLNKQKMQVTVNAGNEAVHRTAFMVAFANAKTYGTGAVINPEGKMNDGIFEIVIVKKLKLGALLRMFIRPGMFNPDNIEIIACTQASISTRKPMHFQVDGEYKGREKLIKAAVQKEVLKLILPPGK